MDEHTFFQTIQEQRTSLVEGQLSSVELVELYLARIDRYNSMLYAFVAVFAEEALQAAKEADDARARGYSNGLLELSLIHI